MLATQVGSLWVRQIQQCIEHTSKISAVYICDNYVIFDQSCQYQEGFRSSGTLGSSSRVKSILFDFSKQNNNSPSYR